MESADDAPRDHSRIVLTIAVVAVIAMVSSAIIGLVRGGHDHHHRAPVPTKTTPVVTTISVGLRG